MYGKTEFGLRPTFSVFAGPKNEPPPAVQEKVLSLIQAWSDAFRHQPDLSGVSQVSSGAYGDTVLSILLTVGHKITQELSTKCVGILCYKVHLPLQPPHLFCFVTGVC